MTMINKYNDLLESFKEKFDQAPKMNHASSILLFRHYLHVLLEWKKLLGNDSEYIKSPEAHNLFLDLNPDWLQELKPFEEFYQDLLGMGINVGTGRSRESTFIYLFICWEMYKDKPEISQYNLPNPYEAVIKIVEREKSIMSHHAQFVINDITFLNREKYRDFKLPSLEDAFLDFIDSKYDFKKNKIPNQTETNQLWEEFSLKS